MDVTSLCRNYLRIFDAIPSDIPWGVIALERHVMVVDSREESTSVIMEAVASRFGTIIATESIASQRCDSGPLLGCLLHVAGDADDVEGRLRAAYWQATEPCGDRENPPF
ncbi:hypothetical protein [Aporhodopirellula aestuarii]|uniref:Uncharacterized protein n=1 Tax=Aporhodopirellula aestuarii TaxID=2950107 RepID=A0ABT0U6Z3_9BACT|nr:hypothetical protein [Aporhodopirellula aestuarii]MCM2372694.1 hypothetical protein [Aporhodopirellula aestuarii]